MGRGARWRAWRVAESCTESGSHGLMAMVARASRGKGMDLGVAAEG